ncbi:MAG: glycosyltransferase [Thermodesulfobacteriota bacterium]
MEELRRCQVVYLDEYDPNNPDQVVITFDGIYENVFTHAFPILKKFGYPFELFIIGNFIGKNNSFDQGEPLINFAGSAQLRSMVQHGGRLQWHSWSHPDLSKINKKEEIESEIFIPAHIRDLDPKGFAWFAYPHGRVPSFGQQIIKDFFKGAVLCDQGKDYDLYNLKRITVTNKTSFAKSTVSLIIANYNYGRFAAEAIESAIHQTVQPDEILFIDDCSEDNSMEVANRYKEKIRIVRNERNLGIVDNFNKAVSLTSGKYICFLGADNRLRSDYIEKCKLALDLHPQAAIAYTNIIIFGPRAEILAHKVHASPIEECKEIFLWRFPEFTDETKQLLRSRNFIHGSSMYRREAFEEVGGYKKSNGPEDHHLFIRIIDKGWKAVLCPEFLLEYRQHSNDQANTYLNMGIELAFLRRQYNLLIQQLEALMKKEKIIQQTLHQVSTHAQQEKVEEAIEIILETLRKFPEHGKLILQYALLLKLKGSADQAKKYFEYALLYNPNFRELEKYYNDKNIRPPKGVGNSEGVILGQNTTPKVDQVIDPTPEGANADLEAIMKRKQTQVNSNENSKNDTNLSTKKENQNGVRVSIIIPVHNQLEFTRNCLKGIFEHTNESYELIIVDNASYDGTREFILGLKEYPIRPLFLSSNIGFGRACNLGAKIAKGKYLVFLNNDTEVTHEWLKPLVQFMENNSDCGAVGSKLVYPDGRLQEAGGIIFADGQGWNYGRGMDPSDPRFNFVREVDYCSGAALMIRKNVWDEIGGFDLRYAPAYYEDTDLCFEIRKRGYKVYYHPRSVVLHHEGKTAGTDLQSGYKKYQEINRFKFIGKWRAELKKQFPNDPRNVFKASDRRAMKNILVIDAFLPFYDRASGSLRLFQILKMLKKLKFHITFLARDGSLESQYRPVLEEMGIEVYAGDYEAMKAAGYKDNPWHSISYDSLFKYRSYDFALIEFWEVANYYSPIIRKFSPQTKIIIDTVDIHFVREMREAELKQNPELKRRALLNKEREIAVYNKADRIWVVTENDKKAIANLVNNIPIDVVPNIHERNDFIKKYEESSDLLFVGNFNHPPNRDAIHFFCREIFPLIKKKLSGVKFYIVGNNPPEDIKMLACSEIIVTGYVPDLSPYLKNARITVSPLRYGAGMKGKIGEALSWGLPVVTTSVGAEGMELIDGEDALIADSPEEFAEKVVQLYHDPILWKNLSDKGKKKVEINWAPEVINKKLAEIFGSEKLQVEERLISIIIPMHNQFKYTKKCLESLFNYTDVPFELIIVNNGCTDETPEYLKAIREGRQSIAGWKFFAEENGEIKEKRFGGKRKNKKKKATKYFYCKRFKIISNDKNMGFAAGNNRGIAEAKGDYILLLNNDVVVTPGWLKRMLNIAERKSEIGIIGPMSNYVSGPQLLEDVKYNIHTLEGLNEFAIQYAQKNQGRARQFWRVVGFCMLIKKAVIEKIGGLDERYGIGNFEDDDFSIRARLAGFESWIAEDSYVHHFGNRTFIGESIEYSESLKRNWEIFKKKWGIPEDIEYGAKYDLGWILNQDFDPIKHYYPINADELSIYQGEALFNMGDMEGAEHIFQRILSWDPKNVDVLNDLGVICFQKGEFEQAIAYFNQVLKLNENHSEALENLGNCLIAQSKFGEAISYYERALNLRPRDVSLLNSLANCFIHLEDYAKAEEVYKKSYQIDNHQIHVREIINEIDKMKMFENQGSMVT